MLNISLAVPIWFEARANTVESGSATDARAKVLYRVHEVDCADENTGENSRPLLDA